MERTELYAHVLPTGRPNPIEVSPFPVDDTTPREEEISETVMQIWMHRSGSPSGMKSEHLRFWHRVAKREEYPDPGNWEKVVTSIQAAFRGGVTHSAMHLVGGGDDPRGGRHHLPG